MNWYRITGTAIATLACCSAIYVIWSDPDASRWELALSGVLIVAVLAVAFCIGVLAWFFITETLRPAVICQKPAAPSALATREAALVGRRRYRMRPVDFLAVITFGGRVAFGLMVFGKIHHIDFNEDEA